MLGTICPGVGVLEFWISEVLERWNLHLGGILEPAGVRGFWVLREGADFPDFGGSGCNNRSRSKFRDEAVGRRGDCNRLGRQPGAHRRGKDRSQGFRQVPLESMTTFIFFH